MWLTDKDRAEKTAIREVFPDCEQFLCSFHVLQSFRRELNLAGVGKAERERILGVLQQLVYANSDDEYSRLRENIRHPATDRYLKDNWDDIRWEWVRGLSGAAMSGVFTNNHLESLHGKMKSVCRANDTLPNFIKSYLTVLTTVRADRNAEIHSETCKRPTSCRFPELQEYQQQVTSFALSLLQEELVQSAVVTLTTSPGGQQTACDRSGRVDVSPTECSCLFRRHYDLPCRHMMAVRQNHRLCLFSQELLSQKWLLSFAADHLEAQVALRAATNPSISTCRLPPRDPPRTERDRFRQLQGITSQIASVGSELTGQAHRELAEKLTKVLDFLQHGRSFLIVEEVDMPADNEEGDDVDAAACEADPLSFDIPAQSTDHAAVPNDAVPAAATTANTQHDVEMPVFNLLWDSLNSPPRNDSQQAPMTPQRTPCQPHQPEVPSPLAGARTLDFSGRLTPRYVVPSPSRRATPQGTPRHHVSAVPRRLVTQPSSDLIPPRATCQSHDAAVPMAFARRSLWSSNTDADNVQQSIHRSRSRSPSQAEDVDDPPVIDVLSPVIGPSPVIGGLFPRARAVAAGAPVAGPSSGTASQLTWRGGDGVGLQHLRMPPRTMKNRGRPKGSKTTVVGLTRK